MVARGCSADEYSRHGVKYFFLVFDLDGVSHFLLTSCVSGLLLSKPRYTQSVIPGSPWGSLSVLGAQDLPAWTRSAESAAQVPSLEVAAGTAVPAGRDTDPP